MTPGTHSAMPAADRACHVAPRTPEFKQVPIVALQRGRYQPRTRFAPNGLQELATTIRAEGMIQPIKVRPLPAAAPPRYEIVAGERRWRAAQLAGLQDVPVLVEPLGDRDALLQALIENRLREDLNPLDLARGIARLVDEFRITQLAVGEHLGISRDAVSHYLRLLRLDSRIHELVESGCLAFGHAKLLVSLPCEQQVRLAREVVHQRLSVRQLERRIKRLARPAARPVTRDADIARLEQRVAELVGAPVAIAFNSRSGHGRLKMDFHSVDQLQGILERLGYDEA